MATRSAGSADGAAGPGGSEPMPESVAESAPPGLIAPQALRRAHGEPVAIATLRAAPEDFRVDEIMAHVPDGAGPHVWLHVEKRGANTHWVARRIADVAGVRLDAVGYAGRKDRHALARQWFSVALGERSSRDWGALDDDSVRVLAARRHRRKLRRGALAGNRFRITLRDVRGEGPAVDARLARIARHGVPSYFGEQRFGRDAGNLHAAWALARGGRRERSRARRGLYLSAARSLIFNRVLDARVGAGCWDEAVAGDVMMLAGSHSVFRLDTPDDAVRDRLARHDVHPTGPLWGRGSRMVELRARDLEDRALAGCAPWQSWLERAGLEQARRALRVVPGELSWEHPQRDGSATALVLEFTLPAGCYATAVLRELVAARD